jgi:hypothetical protein
LLAAYWLTIGTTNIGGQGNTMKLVGIKKYYVGFIVLVVITAGITIYTLIQGASSKQDIQTEKKAQEIATKLNSFIASKFELPASLEEAGIKDVPDTIKYTVKDDTSYKFCVTYKAASSYGSGDITSLLWGSALRDLSQVDTSNYDSPDYASSSLYLSYYHKKGENCQTVKPYNLYIPSNNDYYSSYNSNTSTSTISVAARDTERQTDIKALHGQIEAYYAQNGFYPTLADLNNSTFRSVSLKSLDTEALKDPVGKTAKLVASPLKNYYSYAATTADGKTCDNVTNDCAVYTLTATLEKGGTFTKANLN